MYRRTTFRWRRWCTSPCPRSPWLSRDLVGLALQSQHTVHVQENTCTRRASTADTKSTCKIEAIEGFVCCLPALLCLMLVSSDRRPYGCVLRQKPVSEHRALNHCTKREHLDNTYQTCSLAISGPGFSRKPHPFHSLLHLYYVLSSIFDMLYSYQLQYQVLQL